MSKIEDALEIIKGMTLLELRDLNKAIETEFGITAAAPMMAAGPAAGAKSKYPTEFIVYLIWREPSTGDAPAAAK